MTSSRLFIRIAKLALFFTYLIVLAGGFVRMTGSGMGCPDWPKCFGLLIPPFSENEITWSAGQEYTSSQMLIHNEKLWIAKKNFISTSSFDKDNWKPFEKHNYAKFNVFHTWAEYVNRCIGAIAGLFVIALFVYSVFNKLSFYQIFGSLILLILFGVQAWIGGEVVFSVLDPFKITIHMFVALIIVSILFVLIHMAEKSIDKNIPTIKNNFNKLIILTLLFSIVQIYFGTQVREFVDSLPSDKSIWILEINNSHINIHQLVAVFVFILNIYLCVYLAGKFNSFKEIPREVVYIFSTILILVISGIIMLNFNFPGFAQLVHLFSAFVLFGAQFSLFLKFKLI